MTAAPKVPGSSPGRRRRARLQVVTAPADELGRALAGMDEAFLQCRDFGHGWQPYTARRVAEGYESVLRCSRCLTVRVRLIGMRGQVLRTGYEYPDGYRVHGLGQLTGSDRDRLRLASIERLLPLLPHPGDGDGAA